MIRLINDDCLKVLPTLEGGSVDMVITDPPYGINKADWDTDFPVAWYSHAKRIAATTVIITDSARVKDSVLLVGDDFLDVFAARNLNGMTFGPLGFSNWIAAVIAGAKPKVKTGQNFFEFAVRGEKPNHPSPKPIEYMVKLLRRLCNPGDVICDPMMGSGTTGLACVELGMSFIGIELSPEYFAIAEKRIAAAQRHQAENPALPF